MSSFQIDTNIEEKINLFFDDFPQKSFTFTNLSELLFANREILQVPKEIRPKQFVDTLLNLHLREVELVSETYSNLKRFVWKYPSAYLVAQPLKKRSFFSHGSAAYLHGFAIDKGQKIYLNYEQSPKGRRWDPNPRWNTPGFCQQAKTFEFDLQLRR
jgi:hypothetical protein